MSRLDNFDQIMAQCVPLSSTLLKTNKDDVRSSDEPENSFYNLSYCVR